MDVGHDDPWDPFGCKRFIVNVVGNEERFPEQEPYRPGAIVLLQRLIDRYSADYSKSCACVLRDFLEDLDEGTLEEKTLWHEWRLAHADRVVCPYAYLRMS